ncbi:golgin-84-like [Hibiscus syriacus]|uniref:golgin-84-like n=1 Tax=Hibiscus syriacus TaxID=106335 RepID=UPI0019228FB6|nr:golgin-84-like [Hibiscus syriacus]
MVQTSTDLYNNSEKDSPKVPISGSLDTDVVKHGADQEEASAIVNNADASLSTSNVSFSMRMLLMFKYTESQIADVPSKSEQEKSQHVVVDSHVNSEAKLKEDDVKIETPVNQNKLQAQNVVTPPKMAQDQLDEAQGLLKTTNSTGQSKKARLARVSSLNLLVFLLVLNIETNVYSSN